MQQGLIIGVLRVRTHIYFHWRTHDFGHANVDTTLIFFPMIFLSFKNFSCCYNFVLFKNLLLYICFLIYLFVLVSSVRNSPRQSANAEPFAEAYLHFVVFASAIKMPRQLCSQKFFLKSFPRTKKEIFCKRKKDFHKKNFFTRHKLFMCIYIHYSYLHFVYF